MADVLFLVILVAFFALAVLFVRACEWLIGADLEAAPSVEPVEPEEELAA